MWDRRGAPATTKAVPEKVVDGRAGRQRMLHRPGGPTYEVALDEIAIRRLAAPDDVLKAQLKQLAEAGNNGSRIAVRVLPVTARISNFTVPRCTFSLYTFADPRDPMVVAIDTVTSDLVLTQPNEVAAYDELTGQDVDWRKSSRSNSSGDCVELAIIGATSAELPPADDHNEPR